MKIQLRRLPARREIQRPEVHAGEDAREIGRVEVDFNALQLNQFCELPKND